MRLVVYYRVSGGGNSKPRPSWYSKERGLRSMLAALGPARQAHDVDVHFVADGPVPEGLADLVRSSGTVHPITAGSAAKSYRRMLALAVEGHGAPDDLLWLCEDDYLYRPEALQSLCAAATGIESADYFSLYTPDNAAWHGTHRSQPDRRGATERYDVGGQQWNSCWASNSSFAVRRAALAGDVRTHMLCSLAGSSWDHACLSTVQGVQPYAWRHLTADVTPPTSRSNAVRTLAQPLLRGTINVVAARRRSRPRRWVAPAVDLTTHMEGGQVAPGFDWQTYALSL